LDVKNIIATAKQKHYLRENWNQKNVVKFAFPKIRIKNVSDIKGGVETRISFFKKKYAYQMMD